MNIRFFLQTRFLLTLFNKTLGRAFEALRENKIYAESLKSSTKCLKGSVACLCYNITHAMLIDNGSF